MQKIIGFLFLTALWFAPTPAQASGSLGEALKELAGDVKAYIKGGNVSIGKFRGQGDLAKYASSGPLLYTGLEHELKAKGLTVVAEKGDYEVFGEYDVYEDTITERQFVQINLEVRDSTGVSRFFSGKEMVNGKEVATKYFVKEENDLAKLIGPTVYVPPQATEKQRIEAYKKAVDAPSVAIEGTRIYAGKGAPFAIEMLTAPQKKPSGVQRKKEEYKVRPPQVKDGLAFVPIARNEVYGVRIFNYADYDVAVDLRIDGLSMFQASEIKDKKTGLPLYRFAIIRKKTNAFIPGWFINLKHTDEFLVGEYAKSEAAKVGQTANVGTVTATFHAAWDPKSGPPADEPRNPAEFSHSADATIRGNRVDFNYNLVNHEIGVFRGAVSVRYTK